MRPVLECEKFLKGSCVFEVNQDSEGVSRTITITLISGADAMAESLTDGEAECLTWMPKSFSDRDLEVPASFIKRVALEVLKFSPADLAVREGLQLQGGRVRAIRHLEFLHVREDAPERAAIPCLARLAEEALFAPFFPNGSESWSFSADQMMAIQKLRTESLLKCGGVRLKGNIQVVVSGAPLVELTGRYAPKPDLSGATTVPGELVGVVTGHNKAKAIIHLLDQNERALNIKFGKIPIEGKILGELEDDRTLLAVQVNIGTDKSGETEYQYVSHERYNPGMAGVSVLA